MSETAALVQFWLRLGDDRLILGHRLSEWCGHAPILEEDLALANVALDLLGQAQRALDFAGSGGRRGHGADDLAYFRDAADFRNCLLVEQPNGDFADTLARQLLFDVWDTHLLEALTRSVESNLSEWARKAELEAQYHLRHSRSWILRLGDGTAESHERIQRAFAALWPFHRELFEDDDVSLALAERGTAPKLALLREPWESQVAAVLREATLALPEVEGTPSGGRRGSHSEHLERLLSEMQSLARAHPGAKW